MSDEGKDALDQHLDQQGQHDEWPWTDKDVEGQEQRAHIAGRLLAMRKQAKLTERALAHKMGYSHQALWKWESGAAPVPLHVLSLWIETCEAEIREYAKWVGRLSA